MKAEDQLKFALRTAVLVEKQSLDFYRYAAKMVSNDKSREVFRLLATEEAEHLGLFHRLYQKHRFGNLNSLINLPADLNAPNYRALLELVDVNTQAKEALAISLYEENACIKLYSDLVKAFNNSDVCNVFEQALQETRIHCKIIQAEYMRVQAKSEKLESVQQPPQLIEINPKRKGVGSTSRLTSKYQRLLTDTGNITEVPDNRQL